MSLVVELFGGPGIGKTTFAAKLFAAVKDDRRFTVSIVLSRAAQQTQTQ